MYQYNKSIPIVKQNGINLLKVSRKQVIYPTIEFDTTMPGRASDKIVIYKNKGSQL